MKFEWNRKYATHALFAVLINLCVALCVFFFLDFNRFYKLFSGILSVFSPILYGVFIAYLLAPFLRFLESKVLYRLDRKGKYRLKRTLSLTIAMLVFLVLLGLLAWQMLPNILRGYADLQEMSGFYLAAVKEWLLALSESEGFLVGYLDDIVVYVVDLLEKIYAAIFSAAPDVAKLASSIVGTAKDLFFGLILSVYFLAAKEKLLAEGKKTAYALLSEKRYHSFMKAVSLTDRKFGGFLKGQLADALIIFCLCFFAMAIIGIPYYPLVSMVVGIAAIIPVFGSLIGTIFGSLIILLADPYEVIWFIILMLCLHIFNQKWLCPRLLRNGRGASPVFMFAALVIMTGLLGFRGLVFGVPVFTTLYAFFEMFVNRRLDSKGLPTDELHYFTTETGRELYKETLARTHSSPDLAGKDTSPLPDLGDDATLASPDLVEKDTSPLPNVGDDALSSPAQPPLSPDGNSADTSESAPR